MTTFAIDYGTWTADPEAFSAFAALLRRRGHRVLLVTARVSGHETVRRECEAHVDRVIFSGAEYKRDTCVTAGEAVSVWIDDNPCMIGPDIPIPDSCRVAELRAEIDRLREQLRDAEEAAAVYRDEAAMLRRSQGGQQ